MTGMHVVAVLFVTFLLGVGILHYRQLRGDARRRDAARSTWKMQREMRLRKQREGALLREIERCFPFLLEEVKRRIRTGDSLRDAVRGAAGSLEGVHLGTTDTGLPLILLASHRARHALLLGKSGYGKSSTMVHMISEDLR